MDYLTLLGQLLPPGIAMSPEQDDTADLLTKTARELEAVAGLDESLFVEIDPRNAVLLLDETEASLGLPDRCTFGSQSVGERQAAAYNKLVDAGGARRTRYLGILRRLGQLQADIERFALHTCQHTCEDAVFDHTEWLFTWAITLKENTLSTPATCQSHCEEPLALWGNTQTECVLHKEKPAYSNLLIKYAGSL